MNHQYNKKIDSSSLRIKTNHITIIIMDAKPDNSDNTCKKTVDELLTLYVESMNCYERVAYEIAQKILKVVTTWKRVLDSKIF